MKFITTNRFEKNDICNQFFRMTYTYVIFDKLINTRHPDLITYINNKISNDSVLYYYTLLKLSSKQSKKIFK